jgi:hypothetical protein
MPIGIINELTLHLRGMTCRVVRRPCLNLRRPIYRCARPQTSLRRSGLSFSGSDLVETSKALLNYERVEFAVTRGWSSDTILR